MIRYLMVPTDISLFSWRISHQLPCFFTFLQNCIFWDPPSYLLFSNIWFFFHLCKLGTYFYCGDLKAVSKFLQNWVSSLTITHSSHFHLLNLLCLTVLSRIAFSAIHCSTSFVWSNESSSFPMIWNCPLITPIFIVFLQIPLDATKFWVVFGQEHKCHK